MDKSENRVKKILYVRSAPYELTFDNYNLQEVGLGTAFCQRGYDFDLVYYSKENRDQVIDVGDRKLTILWRKGIKLLRSGIYSFLLNREFLSKYDIVIASEYSQITSYLLARRHSNVYIYNGPYYNLFKIPFIEPIYDKLFCKKINQLMKKTFCKTQMSADYIATKGITNSIVTGVGLDTTKFDNEKVIDSNTQELLNKMQGHRNFLYVGSIVSRKNVELIINAFVKLKKDERFKDVQLIVVGKGDDKYTQKCKALIPKDLEKSVVWCKFIKNAQLKFVYQKADAFLLPSVQEIFGMVLLEAMYFSLPVISSHSAGAGTLIINENNGVIVEEFDPDIWEHKMETILDNPEMSKKYGENAKYTIQNNFLWKNIVDKMLKFIEN